MGCGSAIELVSMTLRELRSALLSLTSISGTLVGGNQNTTSECLLTTWAAMFSTPGPTRRGTRLTSLSLEQVLVVYAVPLNYTDKALK